MGIYMNFDGIEGEATQQDHKKWIDVLSLSWGVGRGISTVEENNNNREASEPSLSDVTIIKNFDAASPSLFTEATAGNAGKTVKIELTTTGEPSVVTCTYTLSNALISSYSVSTSSERPIESISISYTKLEFKFTPYDEAHKAGAPTTISYDLASAKASAVEGGDLENTVLRSANITASYQDATHKITTAIGSAFGDYVEGTNNEEVLNGLSGNDVLLGRGGNDSINGGSGIDTVRYQGMRSEFNVSSASNVNATNQLGKDLPQDLLKFVDLSLFNVGNGDVRTVSDKVAGRSGVDTLSNVERVQFVDGTLLFDVAKTEANSTLYKLYQATFARAADQNGFLGWVDQIKNGSAILQIAKDFLNSSEFSQSFGSVTQSNAAFVNLLYRNALGREGDAAGSQGWVNALQSGQLSRADVLLAFATSYEASVKTAGNIDPGYWVV